MEADSRIGMATARVFFYDRPTDVYWDGGIIDWTTGLTAHSSNDLPRFGGILSSEWLDSCWLFVRLAALNDVGLLDERYFLRRGPQLSSNQEVTIGLGARSR